MDTQTDDPTYDTSREEENPLLVSLQQSNMLHLLPVAAYICDMDGLIKGYNDLAAGLWGRRPVLGNKDERYNGAYRLYQPDGAYLPHDQAPVASCLKDGLPRKNIIAIMERPDASRIYVNINVAPVTNSDGRQTGVFNCFYDITAQKAAESTLQRKTLELQDYVDNANIGLHWVDADGVIKWANKAELDMLGYAEEEYIGQHISKFHVQQEKTEDILTRLSQRQTLSLYESELRCKDGSVKTVHINSSVFHEADKFIHTRCFTIDVSNLKAKEKALLESEEKLRLLAKSLEEKVIAKIKELDKSEERYHKMVEEVEDYAIILLDKEGVIQNWNKGAEKIKGYREQDIVGKSFQEFYLPEDQQRGLPLQLLRQARETGKATHEGWRKKSDGTAFWGSIVLTALHDEQRNVIGFSKVTRDLTERKLAEDRQKAYLDQLELQNRELEQFVYAASHDLKEPLRKIHLYNSFIAENPANTLDAKSTDYLARSINASERMKSLIESLLAYSRATVNMEGYDDVDVKAVVEELVAFNKEEFEQKNVRIITENPGIIRAVPFQIKQLMSNLIDNAVKYSHPGRNAVITIRQEIVSGSNLLKYKASPGKQYHKITVADNGVGFDTKYAEKIFEIFQRLNAGTSVRGSGIGLAICKKIVQNHQGFIIATGVPGQGASFFVYLPVS